MYGGDINGDYLAGREKQDLQNQESTRTHVSLIELEYSNYKCNAVSLIRDTRFLQPTKELKADEPAAKRQQGDG
ncbi:hypothetical protein FRC00_007500, partial [Tulasnella sp. 408]